MEAISQPHSTSLRGSPLSSGDVWALGPCCWEQDKVPQAPAFWQHHCGGRQVGANTVPWSPPCVGTEQVRPAIHTLAQSPPHCRLKAAEPHSPTGQAVCQTFIWGGGRRTQWDKCPREPKGEDTAVTELQSRGRTRARLARQLLHSVGSGHPVPAAPSPGWGRPGPCCAQEATRL